MTIDEALERVNWPDDSDEYEEAARICAAEVRRLQAERDDYKQRCKDLKDLLDSETRTVDELLGIIGNLQKQLHDNAAKESTNHERTKND